ncbi:PilN domain-containing protein [Facilibium subflavum]|uniref:PilN domain-containing protein n=1 Tax=Facilibium subflavum TaxID=2219058 RepID=UPI000E65759F|nr:PilN domain-containing protein [Facilibium subflavum]
MLYEVNLFPWRENKLKRRIKAFAYGLAMSVTLGILVLIVWFLFAMNSISIQNARNTYLKEKNAALKFKVNKAYSLNAKKKTLLHQVKLLNALQQKQEQSLMSWAALSRALPDNVYLLSITHKGSALLIDGRAESNKGIAQLMRNLNESPYFDKATLSRINLINQSSDKETEQAFEVTIPLHSVKALSD